MAGRADLGREGKRKIVGGGKSLSLRFLFPEELRMKGMDGIDLIPEGLDEPVEAFLTVFFSPRDEGCGDHSFKRVRFLFGYLLNE